MKPGVVRGGRKFSFLNNIWNSVEKIRDDTPGFWVSKKFMNVCNAAVIAFYAHKCLVGYFTSYYVATYQMTEIWWQTILQRKSTDISLDIWLYCAKLTFLGSLVFINLLFAWLCIGWIDFSRNTGITHVHHS